MEFFHRAALVKNRVDRLTAEARTCTDRDRLAAIEREMQVCCDSMYAIREEQLLDMLPKPKKKRWWRRG